MKPLTLKVIWQIVSPSSSKWHYSVYRHVIENFVIGFDQELLFFKRYGQISEL